MGRTFLSSRASSQVSHGYDHILTSPRMPNPVSSVLLSLHTSTPVVAIYPAWHAQRICFLKVLSLMLPVRPKSDRFTNHQHPFTVLSSHSTVEFTNASDGRQVELEVKGDWLDRSANITFGGEPVANIGRSFFNIREIFADKQTVRIINFSND